MKDDANLWEGRRGVGSSSQLEGPAELSASIAQLLSIEKVFAEKAESEQ